MLQCKPIRVCQIRTYIHIISEICPDNQIPFPPQNLILLTPPQNSSIRPDPISMIIPPQFRHDSIRPICRSDICSAFCGENPCKACPSAEFENRLPLKVLLEQPLCKEETCFPGPKTGCATWDQERWLLWDVYFFARGEGVSENRFCCGWDNCWRILNECCIVY